MIKQIKMFARFNIYRNIWYSCLAIMLVAFVSSCVEDDELPKQVETRAMATTRVAIADNANIKTARVLIFGTDRNRVYIGDKINIAESQIEGQILTIRNSTPIQVNVGTNHVYVVLNEETGNFTDDTFNAITTVDAMEVLRETPIEYTDIIAVTDGEEPAFLMCVYDEVEIASNSSAEPLVLDLTGSQENNGFSMRRPMAKVVLESVIGGVKPNGYIVGTDDKMKWNGDVNVDQSEDPENQDLIATSAVHVLGVELINVPTQYSWKQDYILDNTNYYRADPISIAEEIVPENQKPKGYLGRTWPGSITVSGIVPFTRVDYLADFWKTADNSASYAVVFEDKVPDEYFIYSLNDVQDNKNVKSNYKDYSYYTINDEGLVTLFNINNSDIGMPPSNDKYNLDNGGFFDFFMNQYWNNQMYRAGTPIAGEPEGTIEINPAVWELEYKQNAYYIPENITQDERKQSKLRIKLFIATASASFTEEEIQTFIQEFMKDNPGYVGDLVQDEGTLYLGDGKDKKGKDNISKFLWAKGEFVQHSVDKTKYAVKYGGLKREFRGETEVKSKSGSYQTIIESGMPIYTIEIPLNNDGEEYNEDSTPYDHNIYRGHEYKVKLYITKKGAWDEAKQETASSYASRSVSIAGEEFEIVGKVVKTPMK